MKIKPHNFESACWPVKGMTLPEVLVVIVMIALLAAFFLPSQPRAKTKAKRINCVNNVKQIGLALRMWANDHGDKLPWQVSVETNGTMELAETPEVYRHFAACSNEIVSPKVLACTADARSERVSTWEKLSNQNLSYFVGLDSSEALPQTILSGDRNITGGTVSINGIMRFGTTDQAGWSQDMHKGAGNIGLADGSATQVTPNGLQKQMQAALLSTNVSALRFSIPKPN